MAAKRVTWQCSYCGTRNGLEAGNRPHPGTCPRRGKGRDGKYKPHIWKKC